MSKEAVEPGCRPFAIIEEQMEAEGKPKVIAWGFACGQTPRFETPKKKARRAFLERTELPHAD